MPEKDPLNYGLLTYAWVFVLSAWGGAVSFWRKVRSGNTRAFNLMELVGELFISAFTGVITFLLAQAANMDLLITAALVGISGHMGSRALAALERWALEKLPR